MSCQSNAEDNQSEFNFFQQMLKHSEVHECCGPLTTIGFTRGSLSSFQKALDLIGLQQNYLDNYDPQVLDSTHMSLTMCPKHWIMHSRGVGKLALEINDESLGQLAYFIYRYTCLTNQWDYKEIINYAKSVSSAKSN